MKRATYDHAGCPVCTSAEQGIVSGLDPARYEVEKVHLGQDPSRIDEARSMGVKTLPALVVDGQVFHINCGAALDDLMAPATTMSEEMPGGERFDCDYD